MALEDDPTYQAYLRAVGFQSDTARSSAAVQTGGVDRKMNFAAPEIAYQGTVERQGIDQQHEARGVFSSGERLLANARQQHDEGVRQAQLQIGGADSIESIQASLAEQIAELERRKAEQALTTAGNMALLGMG